MLFRSVFRYIRRRVDANDAEDLTAEVFLTACRRLAEVPAGAELPWLYRTAWNHVSNHWRKRTPLVVEQVQETADEFDDFADLVTESAALRAAWSSLSARDREVLRLVAWEGLDGAGLAAALGISVSGAGAALWRARQRLSAAYGSVGGEEPPAQDHSGVSPQGVRAPAQDLSGIAAQAAGAPAQEVRAPAQDQLRLAAQEPPEPRHRPSDPVGEPGDGRPSVTSDGLGGEQ